MKKSVLILTAAVFVLVSCKKSEENGVVINPQDIGFVYNATLNNLAEVALGQLAADSSQTPEIQAFGQRMVSDHAAAQSELETLASELGINTPDTLAPRHVQLRAALLNLKGRSFDSAYIHNQLIDHVNAVNLFENAHSIGNNWRLKDYARGKVPALLMHRDEAQTLAGQY